MELLQCVCQFPLGARWSHRGCYYTHSVKGRLISPTVQDTQVDKWTSTGNSLLDSQEGDSGGVGSRGSEDGSSDGETQKASDRMHED